MKHDLDPRKPGKGRPDINSSTFFVDLAAVAARWSDVLFEIINTSLTLRRAGGAWALNFANQIFMHADRNGMNLARHEEAREAWLLASWLIMLSAEMDIEASPLQGYSDLERVDALAELRDRLEIAAASHELRTACSARFNIVETRMDLLPRFAMVRLGLNQELCMEHIGIEAASQWKFTGVRSVATRMGSIKRHFDAALWGQHDEDHAIHLLWNFMALYHTCMHFPWRNDCQRVVGIDGRAVLRAVLG